jgi:hypothetical protein
VPRGQRQSTSLTKDAFGAVMGGRRGSTRIEPTGDSALYREVRKVTCVDEDGHETADELTVITYYLYKGGPLHREHAPAEESSHGYKEWWANGLLHRVGGPAIQHPNGTKVWYLEGAVSRLDGPALENWNGTTVWVAEGRLHREDGPAIELHGCHEFDIHIGTRTLLPFARITSDCSPLLLRECADQEWWRDGRPHREDGPAKIWGDGEGWHEWWLDGQLHREGGPALEGADGTNPEWYQHGKLHRSDGPAVIDSDGAEEWYYEGERHREDGPAVQRECGPNEYYLRGKRLSKHEFARRTGTTVYRIRKLERERELKASERWAAAWAPIRHLDLSAW